MLKYLIPIFIAFVGSALLTRVIVAIHDVAIAPGKSRRIMNSGMYRTATASLYRGQGARDSAGQEKAWFSWEVDGKKYKRFFPAPPMSSMVRTVYYVNNPRYAVDKLEESGQLQKKWSLMLVLFIILSVIAILVKR